MTDRDDRARPSRLGSVPRQSEDLVAPSAAGRRADDSRTIIAALPTEIRDNLERSILGRDDLHVRFVAELEVALQLVYRRAPALLLVYDAGAGEVPRLLAGLERAVKSNTFPVIVLAEFPDESYPRIVTRALPVDMDAGELSVVIAQAVQLPTRARRRHLIRVGVRLDDPISLAATGNTVDVSASGMLIECTKRLRVGDLYQVSILGVGDVPMLSLRLVREADASHPNLHRYGGAFEGVEPDVVEELIRRLADA